MRSCALLLALVAAAPAEAFVRSRVPGGGPCLFWARRQLDYWLNSDGSGDVPGDAELNASRRSFRHWQDVLCSDLSFVDRGLTSRRDVGFVEKATNNQNIVLWRKTLCDDAVPAGDACQDTGGCANQYDCWDHASQVIGVTTTTFNRATGQIVDADIELNDAGYTFTVTDNPLLARTDVENTVTHEIGHFIGLDHTTVAGATMAASAREGDLDKRSLEQDDEEGLCSIYPAGRQPSTCITDGPVEIDSIDSDDNDGCFGCAAGPSSGWLLALLVLCPIGRRRRTTASPGFGD